MPSHSIFTSEYVHLLISSARGGLTGLGSFFVLSWKMSNQKKDLLSSLLKAVDLWTRVDSNCIDSIISIFTVKTFSFSYKFCHDIFIKKKKIQWFLAYCIKFDIILRSPVFLLQRTLCQHSSFNGVHSHLLSANDLTIWQQPAVDSLLSVSSGIHHLWGLPSEVDPMGTPTLTRVICPAALLPPAHCSATSAYKRQTDFRRSLKKKKKNVNLTLWNSHQPNKWSDPLAVKIASQIQ